MGNLMGYNILHLLSHSFFGSGVYTWLTQVLYSEFQDYSQDIAWVLFLSDLSREETLELN